jgi:uncharacterized SAM-binding protein YcdF (DUF218 family)
MTSVAIICGYHELHSLASYVALIAPRMQTIAPAFAILSGGVTSADAAQSEAAVMAETLSRVCPEQPFLLDEEAMSTLDNLLNAKALAERTFGRVSRWAVFCDSAHRRKVATLARRGLGATANVHHVPRRVDLVTRLLEPPTLVVEACAALWPSLRPFVRSTSTWWRRRRASSV